MNQLTEKFSIFNPKIVSKLSAIWVWDPGSETQDPKKKLIPVPDSWIKKALDSGSATLTVIKINHLSEF